MYKYRILLHLIYFAASMVDEGMKYKNLAHTLSPYSGLILFVQGIKTCNLISEAQTKHQKGF